MSSNFCIYPHLRMGSRCNLASYGARGRSSSLSLKGLRMKWSWHICHHSSRRKVVSQDSRPLDWDLNRVLPTDSTSAVTFSDANRTEVCQYSIQWQTSVVIYTSSAATYRSSSNHTAPLSCRRCVDDNCTVESGSCSPIQEDQAPASIPDTCSNSLQSPATLQKHWS
jgi:hypothetical protein